jgi:hypothetical protein
MWVNRVHIVHGGKACYIRFRGRGWWKCWVGGRRCGCDVNRGGSSCCGGGGGVEPILKVVSELPEALLIEGVGRPFNSLRARGGTAE